MADRYDAVLAAIPALLLAGGATEVLLSGPGVPAPLSGVPFAGLGLAGAVAIVGNELTGPLG